MKTDQEAFELAIRKRCISYEVGGFRPPESPYSSWFGKVTLALPNERWPCSNGKPMIPLAQVNLSTLPFRPKGLDDLEFLSVFMDSERLPVNHPPNGEGWLIRTYSNLESLVEVEPPPYISHIKPFPMRSRVKEPDYPCWEDVPCEVPLEIEDQFFDLYENVNGFKLGGWPTLIQSEIFWAPWNKHPAKPEYVFQIDTEQKANWGWGHGGVGYFGRGTEKGHENEWVLEWQCH